MTSLGTEGEGRAGELVGRNVHKNVEISIVRILALSTFAN